MNNTSLTLALGVFRQAMLVQMANPRIPEADKNALLALMAAEAEALAAEAANRHDAGREVGDTNAPS